MVVRIPDFSDKNDAERSRVGRRFGSAAYNGRKSDALSPSACDPQPTSGLSSAEAVRFAALIGSALVLIASAWDAVAKERKVRDENNY